MKSVQCEKCGTICNLKDGYCSECWTKLPGAEEFELDGISETVWDNFIGPKSQRYIDVYKKNKGKKLFLGWNWAAFFFGINWMVFRKMYKFALIACIISTLLSVVATVAFILPHKDRIMELNQDIAAYEEYVASGNPTVKYNPAGSAYSPNVVKKGAAAQKEFLKIQTGVFFKAIFVVWLLNVLMGLFGDSIYKLHILKYSENTERGGTSWGSVLLWRVMYSLIDWLVFTPLLSLISIF